MTPDPSLGIRWEQRGYSGNLYFYGFIEEFGTEICWCLADGPAYGYAADYKDDKMHWCNLDVPFNSFEEAKQWLEMIYATGAWK